MVNLLLSSARMVAATQKRKRGTANLAPLFSLPVLEGENSYAQLAAQLRQALRERGVRDKKVNLILGEEVVFKEFSHQPVNQKALLSFARLEAKTVLREEAARFSVACMNYGTRQNAQGEETAMLLATPTVLLKTIKTAFSGEGFSLEGVHTLFGCYSAVLEKVLPEVLPQLTGAALDFSYEYTLIHLYDKGLLVSQRRLPGVASSLSAIVREETGCANAEVAQHLSEGNFSPAAQARMKEALTGYTYDILRTLRVISAPLHITPEQFFLSGGAIQDEMFLSLVKESLGLPCTVADEADSALGKFVSSHAPAGGLLLLAGSAYDTVDLYSELRQKKTGNILNTGVCAALTAVVAVGVMAQPFARTLKQSVVDATRVRYDQLQTVQQALDALSAANARLASIDEKAAALQESFTGTTGTVLAQVLALFGDGLTLQSISVTAETGAYDVTFNAYNEAYFLALKDKLYQSDAYSFDLQLSVTRKNEDGSYDCQLHFVPAAAKLPVQAQPSEATQETPAQPTTEELMGGV